VKMLKSAMFFIQVSNEFVILEAAKSDPDGVLSALLRNLGKF